MDDPSTCHQKDILIVGQGLSGSILSWYATRAGLTFDIYDRGALRSASAISSGLINPVTGPAYVKSWLIDKLLPKAIECYTSMARQMGCDLIYQIPIWHHLPDVKSEQQWYHRLSMPGYAELIDDPFSADLLGIAGADRYGRVVQSYRVDVKRLVSQMRADLQSNAILYNEDFHSAQLIRNSDGSFSYKDRSYRHVIFAMGYKASLGDTWFDNEAYRPVKGDAFIATIDDLPTDVIFKRKKFIIPLDGHRYWVGSNYDRDYQSPDPDPETRTFFVHFLKDTLRDRRHTIDQHLSGIRPATKYRRPLIGVHPKVPHLYLFNGLGTKGVSIAPYFAQRLIDSIVSGELFINTKSFDKTFSISHSSKGSSD